MMKKKFFLLSMIFISVILLSAAALLYIESKGPKNHEKYNVILVVSDALRKDVLGCYGGDVPTPNIDWLAENGILFERAYSTAPSTMPSSVSMLTGNHSRTYSFAMQKMYKGQPIKHAYYISDEEILPAERLKETGFDMKADVENHLAAVSNTFQGYGFLEFKKKFRKDLIERVEKATGISRSDWFEDSEHRWKYKKLYVWLSHFLNIPQDKRFIFFKWFIDPHSTYDAPQKYRSRIVFDTSRLGHDPEYLSGLHAKEVKELLDADYAYLKKLYKAEVAFLDDRIGYMIKALAHKKFLDNTFIFFTADHGELFMEHGRWGHGGDYYEILVNVPLIVLGPGIPKGKRTDSVVSLLGLMPTVFDILDIDDPEEMQGKSFYPVLLGKEMEDRTPYFERIPTTLDVDRILSDGMMMDGFKLIFTRGAGDKKFRLFDLARDPDELRNCAKNNPETVRKIFSAIQEVREQNRILLIENQKELAMDTEEQTERTLERLRALGYIK